MRSHHQTQCCRFLWHSRVCLYVYACVHVCVRLQILTTVSSSILKCSLSIKRQIDVVYRFTTCTIKPEWDTQLFVWVLPCRLVGNQTHKEPCSSVWPTCWHEMAGRETKEGLLMFPSSIWTDRGTLRQQEKRFLGNLSELEEGKLLGQISSSVTFTSWTRVEQFLQLRVISLAKCSLNICPLILPVYSFTSL